MDGGPRIALDRNDVESHGRAGETPVPDREQGGCPDELALLGPVDGNCGVCESSRSSAADLDEDQAVSVEHHEIDFADAAAKIAGHRSQAVIDEVTIRDLLGAVA